jgi:hypothetical protein
MIVRGKQTIIVEKALAFGDEKETKTRRNRSVGSSSP